jgi:hypothetical protein
MLVLDRADANFRVHVIRTGTTDGAPESNPLRDQVNQFYTRTSYTEPVLKFDNLTPVMYTWAGRMDRCMDDPIWIRMVTPLPEPRVEFGSPSHKSNGQSSLYGRERTNSRHWQRLARSWRRPTTA